MEIDTKSLKYVYFQLSEIESFPEEFMEQLKGVEFFNANGVGLERIDGKSLGKLDEMLVFWGGLNKIESLEARSFSENIKIEAIYLKLNRIQHIDPMAFEGIPQLLALDLSSNRLSKFGRCFDPLIQLVAVDLSSNLIEKLPEDTFKNLKDLRDLKLQNNQFLALDPDLFKPLISLRYINMSFNKHPLNTIVGDLFEFNLNLNQFLFIGNKLKAIDRDFFKHFKQSMDMLSFRFNSCIDDDFIHIKNGTLDESDYVKLNRCFDNFNELLHD